MGCIYITNSLKANARSKRGKGIRRRVRGKNNIPQNWQSLLQNDKNKTELFEVLSHKLMEIPYDGKTVITTHG